MELTGKCKEEFEKWYFKKYCTASVTYEELLPHQQEDVFGWFFNLLPPFKYGVFVDFFDSVGIEITIVKSIANAIGTKWGWHSNVNGKNFTKTYDTRPEARAKAIEKANDLFNKR